VFTPASGVDNGAAISTTPSRPRLLSVFDGKVWLLDGRGGGGGGGGGGTPLLNSFSFANERIKLASERSLESSTRNESTVSLCFERTSVA
jgi:hypothetical protein